MYLFNFILEGHLFFIGTKKTNKRPFSLWYFLEGMYAIFELEQAPDVLEDGEDNDDIQVGRLIFLLLMLSILGVLNTYAYQMAFFFT